MPAVRYYDYGVMRMQSEQRMLDAQRRSAEHDHPYKRVSPSINTQTRSAAESLPICQQNAPECEKTVCACAEQEPCGGCEPLDAPEQCTQRCVGKQGMLSAEELLIAAILLLALSEGGNLPLVLALIYLLM